MVHHLRDRSSEGVCFEKQFPRIVTRRTGRVMMLLVAEGAGTNPWSTKTLYKSGVAAKLLSRRHWDASFPLRHLRPPCRTCHGVFSSDLPLGARSTHTEPYSIRPCASGLEDRSIQTNFYPLAQSQEGCALLCQETQLETRHRNGFHVKPMAARKKLPLHPLP